MNRQLPLLILLSASTFGLGHELGANGPRDNPDTPWGPGDTVEHLNGSSAFKRWMVETGGSFDAYLSALDNDKIESKYIDDVTIAEEVGDWVRMPLFGSIRGGPIVDVWWHYPSIMEAGGLSDEAAYPLALIPKR